MPNTKSAKKFIKTSARKAQRNKIVEGVFRNAIKKTREAVTAGKIEDAKKWLKVALKSLDKASQKKVIKKNTAARRKSRLNKAVKGMPKKK